MNVQLTRPASFNYTLGLFVVVVALMSMSLVMVYASSAPMAGLKVREPQDAAAHVDRMSLSTRMSAFFLRRQIMWAGLGLALMLTASRFKYPRLRSCANWLYAATLLALVLVLFCPARNGSHRWLGLGPVGVQPSEFAKLALVLAMATFLCHRADHIHSFTRFLVPAILLAAPALGLIVVEPDFGATVVLAVLMGLMWFVAGVPIRYLALLGASVVPALAAILVIAPYRIRRIVSFVESFIDPDKNILGSGWHVYQSLIALGSGGVTGVGLGASRQKFYFLCEAHTDFIVSIIGEELGLAGMTLLLVLYAAFILMGLRVAYQTPDYFGMLTAAGLTAMIAVPAIINIGVATRCLPAKGLALPFLSYGGSSMIVNCLAVGILMNIASANHLQKGAG